MIFINAKVFHVILIAALLSSTFLIVEEYKNSHEKSLEIELQMFLPPELQNVSTAKQVARKDLILPTTGKYRVLFNGNCTLYVQTEDGLFKNPDTISIKSRGVRVVIVNQTSDVTVRFVPIRWIPYTPVVFTLIAGGIAGYALRVLKFE